MRTRITVVKKNRPLARFPLWPVESIAQCTHTVSTPASPAMHAAAASQQPERELARPRAAARPWPRSPTVAHPAHALRQSPAHPLVDRVPTQQRLRLTAEKRAWPRASTDALPLRHLPRGFSRTDIQSDIHVSGCKYIPGSSRQGPQPVSRNDPPRIKRSNDLRWNRSDRQSNDARPRTKEHIHTRV